MSDTAAERFGVVPVSKDELESLLGCYKAPRAKLALMERKGELIRLRRGLYLCRPPKGKDFYPELIANQLHSPSYVSFETVLSQSGFIPERVYAIQSACLGRSREFRNATGVYTYTTVAPGYFPIGLTTGRTPEGHGYRVARPEKALCDKIIATPRLRLQSERALVAYLEEDLRFDTERLAGLNPEIVRLCAAASPKKRRELNLLHQLILHERI